MKSTTQHNTTHNTTQRKRLERITEPHAGAWVTAVPATEDGLDTVMRPQVFASQPLTGWVPLLCPMRSLVLCACKPSTNLATTHPAAQRPEITGATQPCAEPAGALLWRRAVVTNRGTSRHPL